MSGIYISGMKLPKDSYYIDIRLFSDGWAHIATDEPPYYNKAFEAFELPPHGDLIDVEVLLEGILGIAFQHSDDPKKVTINANSLLQLIDSLPTIIPADKEDTP